MKKLLTFLTLFLMLGGVASAKDTILFCDEIKYTLKSNRQKLIQEPTITKMLGTEY